MIGDPSEEDDSEYTLQPEAEPAPQAFPQPAPRPIVRPKPQAAPSAVATALAKKNPAVELAKIVIGGIVGLMLGFLVLACVLQMDFNEVLPEQEPAKTAPTGPKPPPPPPGTDVSQQTTPPPASKKQP